MKLFVCCCYYSKLPRLPRFIWGRVVDFVPHIFIYYPLFAEQRHRRDFIKSACALGETDLLNDDHPEINALYGLKYGNKKIVEKYFKREKHRTSKFYKYLFENYSRANYICLTKNIHDNVLWHCIAESYKNFDFEGIISYGKYNVTLEGCYISTEGTSYLAKHNKFELLDQISKEYKNTYSVSFESSICRAACRVGNIKLLNRTITPTMEKERLLYFAMESNNQELIEKMLDWAKPVYNGDMAQIAAFNGNVKLIDYLEKHGQPFSVLGAAQGGQIELIKCRTGLTEEAKKYLIENGYTKLN